MTFRGQLCRPHPRQTRPRQTRGGANTHGAGYLYTLVASRREQSLASSSSSACHPPKRAGPPQSQNRAPSASCQSAGWLASTLLDPNMADADLIACLYPAGVFPWTAKEVIESDPNRPRYAPPRLPPPVAWPANDVPDYDYTPCLRLTFGPAPKRDKGPFAVGIRPATLFFPPVPASVSTMALLPLTSTTALSTTTSTPGVEVR